MPKLNLDIQCNTYENPNGSFSGIEKSILKFMESRGIKNTQAILRKKKAGKLIQDNLKTY